MSSIDFASPDHVDQAKGQIKQGATIWMSMSCLENAVQQHLCHRASKKEQGRKAKAKARQMLKLAISLAEDKLSEGCHIAVDCPEGGWLWDEPDWIAFEKRVSLKRVILQGGSSEIRLCISTNYFSSSAPAIRTTTVQRNRSADCSANHRGILSFAFLLSHPIDVIKPRASDAQPR